MAIPIQNIYYLLCYSWNKLEEKDIVNVDATTCNNVLDLFAKVLINGCVHLFKKGLDRSYIDYAEPIRGIKGKLNVSASLKQNLLSRAQAHCEFDELNHDVLHNQLLRSTVGRLIRTEGIDPGLREQLIEIYRKFRDIIVIKISSQHFRRVVLHRNNFFYDFLLKVCRIIHDNILITEDEGRYKFRNFIEDEARMPQVFEHFVRNFYKREQQDYSVGIEIIRWNAVSMGGDLNKLPQMKTDISLESRTRKIIVDTKYYLSPLTTYFGKEKIYSGHLYQLFAYLKNVAARGGIDAHCEGMLLYPTVDQELDETYRLDGHTVSIRTIDLNQHWKRIHDKLLSILAVPPEAVLQEKSV